MAVSTEKTWLEVSLLVNGELAESVSDVLSRFAHGGVVVEAVITDKGEPQPINGSMDLVKVRAYLPVNEYLADTRRKLEESLWYLGRIQPLPKAHYEYIQEQNWAEAWKQHYHPISIGKTLMVVPAWLRLETGKRVPLLIDPGMAFGTGTHPSTILCLELIEEYLHGSNAVGNFQKNKKPRKFTVIDIGCGSGILCVAALKSGAVRGLAVDVDPIAVEAARQNAALNNVTEHMEMGLGSLLEIQTGKFSLSQADLVFVNILAPVIIQLLGEGVSHLVNDNGRLILSGLIADQEMQIIQALLNCGMRIEHRRMMGDWIALAASHEIS